ncbi:MAG: hypothetical protein M1546_14065 [Chloroflexi bacterium]|nr:hypothetical protein [Chloroflexota bacterium]
MHRSWRTVILTNSIVLSLTLAACSAAPAVPSPSPAIAATIQVNGMPSPSPAPTTEPTLAPLPEPPLVTALPPTATLAQAYPLELGAQRVYSITSITGTPWNLVTATGLLTQTVVDASEQNRMLIFRIWSEQDSSLSDFPHYEPLQYDILFRDAIYWWNSDNPTSLIADLEHGREALPKLIWPLKLGQMFSPISSTMRTDRMYTWDVVSQEEVNTPAGRFSDCFHLIFRTNPDDTQAWFCPGSGFVRREYHHHGSISDITQVLVSHQIVTVTDNHATDAAIKPFQETRITAGIVRGGNHERGRSQTTQG